ncbi:MAG: 3,4-dihydroxy-2-butanone-4-phosphate synthase [Alphaproteobacteria bacterium]|nr:3,4-dihydroxy-2-butanone-4-phosphate synthase [Alphaproteobacteria bacterium]
MSKDNLSTVSKQDIARAADDTRFLSSIDEIIEEARNGRMFILVDDEDRENEGDLVIPAQMATPEAINFMAKFGRGLICLALQGEQVKRLGLELMPQKNASRFGTAFTVSIEAREGVTTGISAPDRARTIAAAVAPDATPENITTPGHIFPLLARDGGVLVRAGHTEAAVDLARLAGLSPAGVICEIMNDDGEMARLPDLIKFAQFHGLKVGAIADLIAHRRQHDRVVDRTESTTLTSVHGGEFAMHVYVNRLNYAEHVALVKGDLKSGSPAFVRMHALSILDDVLMDSEGGKAGDLQKAMDLIGKEGCGVVVLIREPHATSLSDRVRLRENKATEHASGELRDYGIGAQILADLGVHEMVLLSNTEKTVIGLEGYGLKIVGRKALG